MRITENVLPKIEKLLLMWFSDQQAKGDNVMSCLNAKRIFDNGGFYWYLFARKMSLVPKFMTSLERSIIKTCVCIAPRPSFSYQLHF
jgi:hypothetical protein